MWFILVLGGLIALWAVNYWRQYGKMPPSPKTVPLLGNLLDFRGTKLSHEKFLEFSQSFPDMMTVWLSSFTPMVVLNSIEAIRAALVENQHDFASRPDMVMIKAIIPNDSAWDIAFAKYDATFNAHKKMSMQAIRKIIGSTSLEDKVCLAATEIADELAAKTEPVELQPFLLNLVYNVIASFTFGKHFQMNDREFLNLIDLFKKSKEVFGRGAILEAIPYGTRIPTSVWQYVPLFVKLQEVIKTFNDFMNPYIDEHLRNFDENEINDIMDAILLEQKQRKDENIDTTAQITNQQFRLIIQDIFSAGTDTTAATLTWFFLHMILNPKLQDRCYEEICAVIGTQESPKLLHKSSMPFLEACISETLRLNPVAPCAIPHAATRDAALGSYWIPKGTIVIPNIYAIHRNPRHWENPHQFDPNHFLRDGQLVKPQCYIPFGVGRRVCLGEVIARNDLFLIAASLLQRLKFVTVPGHEYTTVPNRKINMQEVADDYVVVVQKRTH